MLVWILNHAQTLGTVVNRGALGDAGGATQVIN
jgi:hypothetical protein